MPLWRVEQAAEYLGIRPKTLYEWVRTGRVPHQKLGFNVRFDPAELERWAREQSAQKRSPEPKAVCAAPAPTLRDLVEVAIEAAQQLRNLESAVGTQLSFPQRQALKSLTERLRKAALAVGNE